MSYRGVVGFAVLLVTAWRSEGILLQMNNNAVRGHSMYITCVVETSATSITLNRPGDITVLICSNTRYCRQQLHGYIHDRSSSNNTRLVLAVMDVDGVDNGTWTCRYGTQKTSHGLFVTDPDYSSVCQPTSPSVSHHQQPKASESKDDGQPNTPFFITLAIAIVLFLALGIMVLLLIKSRRHSSPNEQGLLISAVCTTPSEQYST